MAINVETMSGGEIRSLLAEIDSVQRKRSKRVAKVRAKIDAILKREGLSVEDVYAGGGKRRGRPPGSTNKAKRAVRSRTVKYRNPEDIEQTWGGRGKRPAWFNDALARGATPESLLAGGVAKAGTKTARKPMPNIAKRAGARKTAVVAGSDGAATKSARVGRKARRGKRGGKVGGSAGAA